MSEHNEEELYSVLRTVFRTNLATELNRPENHRTITIYGDEDIAQYIQREIKRINDNEAQIRLHLDNMEKELSIMREEQIKLKEDNNSGDKLDEKYIKERIEKIREMAGDISMVRRELLYYSGRLMGKDVIVYAIKNHKADILEIVYGGKTYRLKDFAESETTRRMIHELL